MWHAYGNAHIHANGDRDGHIHSDCNCYSNSYAYTDSYRDGDCDIYCNGYGNCNSNCDCTAAAYTDSATSADTAGPSGHLLFREF
jgi:hypothetical protein